MHADYDKTALRIELEIAVMRITQMKAIGSESLAPAAEFKFFTVAKNLTTLHGERPKK